MKDIISAICIGVAVTGSLYVIRKIILPTAKLFFYTKKSNINSSDIELSDVAIERKTINFLTRGLKISKESCEIGNIKINQGAKVSFDIDHLGEVVEINGTFIGIKENSAEGYTSNFLVVSDNKVMSAPLETIYTDTLRIYAR